jgi:type IV secretion system protein VirB10
MSIFDRFQKRSAQKTVHELPDMHADEDPSLASAMRVQQSKKERRAAHEKTLAATRSNAENEGLPSVNRKKGGNKLVTILGFVFILGTAAALIVAVNGDKKPKVKKKGGSEEQVMNNLPPIAIPPAPPPIKTSQAAAIPPEGASGAGSGARSGAQPIGLRAQAAGSAKAAGSSPASPGGKPPMEWSDRKMAGGLLVDAKQQPQAGAEGQGSSPRTAVAGNSDAAQATLSGGARPGDPNDLGSKLEPTATKAVSASLLPDRNFLLTKGTTLDCALETALDSSVPGITTCRITRDVYSDNGQVLLLERGSSLVGEYQSGLRQGQVRIFVLWTRAKTPNGVVVALNSPGTDSLGRSGLDGWVDNHFMERFGAAILMSFVKDSVSALASHGSGTTNYYGNAADGGGKIIEKMLDSTVSIPPTIVKNQGDHIQVMVARDLDFSSVYKLQPAP